jgi:hypothetical protein
MQSVFGRQDYVMMCLFRMLRAELTKHPQNAVPGNSFHVLLGGVGKKVDN